MKRGVVVMDGGGVERVEVLGGAPPRRPGRGGGRRWKKEAGERGDGDARHERALAAARDFDPSSDLPLCNFGPSPFLLSSQEGPFLL